MLTFGDEFMNSAKLLSFLLLFSFAIGCERGARKLTAEQTFVIALYEDSAALTDAGDRWGRAIEPWFHGNVADVDELAAADLHVKTIVESVRRKLENRQIPDNPKAREFAALASEYLTWQMEVRKTYAGWHATVRSENPAVIASRQTVINELESLNAEELEWKARINGIGESLGVTVGTEQ